MSKSPHCSQRKKSARVNCADLQETGHGHSARRSLTLHGDSGVRTEVAAMKKLSLARYFQSTIVKSEVLEFKERKKRRKSKTLTLSFRIGERKHD